MSPDQERRLRERATGLLRPNAALAVLLGSITLGACLWVVTHHGHITTGFAFTPVTTLIALVLGYKAALIAQARRALEAEGLHWREGW